MTDNTIASKIRRTVFALFTCSLVLFSNSAHAQRTTVLRTDGSNSPASGPQGGFRYERGFYLVTPKELLNTGLTNGMSLNSIGFTLGATQNISTKGAFKVYLQNTTDTVSRTDTTWTSVNAATNSLSIPSGLFAGNYEWQVRALCSSNSAFSTANNFSNDNLSSCNPPTNLTTTNIKSDSATFNWDAPASSVVKYYVEYKSSDSLNWKLDSSTVLFLRVGNLVPNKNYQWRVRSACSAAGSGLTATSFFTNAISSCGTATGLATGTVTGTTAALSWTAVSGAGFYYVQYRRAGTANWFTSISITNSFTITANLTAGTTYEWQVRSSCAAGTGDYIPGPNFTTTGTTVCYAPENLSANAITDSSVIFKWNSVTGASGYEVRYRLKGTISWTNAITPATLVNSDSLLIPNTAGPYDHVFSGGSSFTYTGGGIYVGWEYSRSTGALSSNNTSMSTTANTVIKDVNGVDSVRYILSLTGRTDSSSTALPSRLVSTNLRPETRLGSVSLNDSVEVVAVYALGKTAPQFQSPSPVTALISNRTNSTKSYNAVLIVANQQTGVQRYTETKNISVPANDSVLVSFTGWSPVIQENVLLTVSVPAQTGENVLNDNSKAYAQSVTPDLLGYPDLSASTGSAGFNTGAGLLLNKQHVTGCSKVIAAKVYLAASAKDHPLYAVVRNAAGTIVAQSASFTPDSTETNGYHSFYFSTPPAFLNEDFYIGLAQQASTAGYYPAGVQWEDATARSGAYYRADLTGASLIDSPAQGRLMIVAEMISSAPQPFVSGNSILCTGATNTLTAGSTQSRYANSVIAYSSQNSNVGFSAQQALGTPDVYPVYGISGNAWVSTTADAQREYLVLGFPDAAPVNYVDLFETANPGAVDTIFVKNPATSAYDVVYTATAAAAAPAARKNHISFPLTAYNVSEIRIAINSPAVSGFNSIDAVAIGESKVPATFSSYLWTGGQTGQTLSVNTAGTYILTVTGAGGCSATDSIKVSATNTVAPTISYSTPLTFCAGDSVILISNRATGNVWSTGATTQSIIAKTADSYTVSYNDGAGCGSLISAPVTVSVNALPVVSISGATGICIGSNTTLDAGAGFASYQWSTGAVSRTITVNSAGTFTVTVTNANGCKKSASVITTMSQLPAPVISGAVQFCSGSSTTLDAGAGYASYAWSTGATSRTITVNTAGNFSVTVTNGNGCSGSTSVTTGFLQSPSPVINGNSAICPGGTLVLTANAGFASYLWSTGSTAQTITINNIGSYSLTVTGSNGCSASTTKLISQAAVPEPVISGTLSFCGSSSTTLDAGIGYSSYLWSTGATSHSITVTTAGTFTVTVINASGCSGSASVTTTTQGSVPVTPGPITGNAGGVCNSAGNVYSISPVTNAAFYVWSVPTGATITSGQGSTSITVSFGSSFTSGNITVAASNACGQSPSNHPRILPVTGIPPVPSAIFGSTTGVCGQSAQVYSITAVNGASSYTWTVPAGVTIINGQSTPSLTVNFTNNFGGGTICVKANSNCGSSAQVCTTVTGAPVTPGPITGTTTPCIKENNVQYSVSPVPGATTYTWTVPQQATIVSGQGTPILKVSFNVKSGNITVKASNNCGTSGAVQTLAVKLVSCSLGGKEETAVVNDLQKDDIQIFPNPTHGIVTIKLPGVEAGTYHLLLSDISGQKILEKDIRQQGKTITEDFGKLSPGVYLVTVYNNNRKYITKLIVQ